MPPEAELEIVPGPRKLPGWARTVGALAAGLVLATTFPASAGAEESQPTEERSAEVGASQQAQTREVRSGDGEVTDSGFRTLDVEGTVFALFKHPNDAKLDFYGAVSPKNGAVFRMNGLEPLNPDTGKRKAVPVPYVVSTGLSQVFVARPSITSENPNEHFFSRHALSSVLTPPTRIIRGRDYDTYNPTNPTIGNQMYDAKGNIVGTVDLTAQEQTRSISYDGELLGIGEWRNHKCPYSPNVSTLITISTGSFEKYNPVTKERKQIIGPEYTGAFTPNAIIPFMLDGEEMIFMSGDTYPNGLCNWRDTIKVFLIGKADGTEVRRTEHQPLATDKSISNVSLDKRGNILYTVDDEHVLGKLGEEGAGRVVGLHANQMINPQFISSESLDTYFPDQPPAKSARWGGKNRAETAVVGNRELLPEGADEAFLVDGSKLTMAATVSASFNPETPSPTYAMGQNLVSEHTMQGMEDMGISKVTIFDTSNAVTSNAEKQLRDRGFEVHKVVAPTQEDLAIKIARMDPEKLASADNLTISTANGDPADVLVTTPTVVAERGIAITIDGRVEGLKTKHAELIRDMPALKTIKIIGGTAAISDEFEAELRETFGQTIKIIRIAGDNRFDTAKNYALIHDDYYDKARNGYIINANNLADGALLGGAIGGGNGIIIPTTRLGMTEHSARLMTETPEITKIGLYGAIDDDIGLRLALKSLGLVLAA